jgi:alcohol dehydrogenase
MKALVFTQANEVVYRDEPDPRKEPGDVLIRVDAVGICGSDMHAYHGHDPRRVPPLILGHEAVGRVVDGSRAGRRAVVNPLISCGRCAACLVGRTNLCAERKMISMNRPGAFAELIAIPERDLIEVPDDMDPVAAALTEPAATALHALHLGMRALPRPMAEAEMLVLGGGSVGLLAALWARAMGCTVPRLAETNALRRATARAAGIDAYDPVASDPGENRFDLVIDAVGGAVTRRAAIRAVRPGGVIVHIGLQDSAGEADFRKITLQEITFIGTYTYTVPDLRASADALYAARLGPLDWVERRALAEGGGAFADLDRGRTGAAKIVLRP